MQTATIDSHNYKFLQEHVYSRAGIVLEQDKHYLFESRLTPIVNQLGLRSINDLCTVVLQNRDSEVSRQVVEAMTTNETFFFREPAHYEALRQTYLPQIKLDRRETKKLRIWSAAASTGQEAYTMAMLLLECGFHDWNVQILGTDFSSKVLERARSRKYQPHEVSRGLPPAYLAKYFHRSGTDWLLNDAVARLVRFEVIDLRQSMRALGPFDIVFCRNVLIYFDAVTKKNIVKEIHNTLERGAWLFLGGAETAFGVDEWFDRQEIGNAVVYVAR